MTHSTAKPESDAADVIDVLVSACERNAVIELHRRDNNESIPAARGRMLSLREDVLYIAEPQIIGRDARLSPGTAIDAFFLADDVMLHFTSEIISTTEMLRLNKDKRVRGYSIAAPTSIAPGQRRSYYRTLVLSEGVVHVTLHPVTSTDPIQCPIDATPVVGTLIDGSPLGFGVNVPNAGIKILRLYETFFLSFTIPRVNIDITTLVELRQNREIDSIGARSLGLLTVPWPTLRKHNLAMQPVLHWFNEAQRRMLRSA